MKKGTKKKNLLFRLGFRLAIMVALLTGLATVPLLFILTELTLIPIVQIAGTLFIFSGLTCYILSYWITYQRLTELEKIAKNISRKRFENYDNISSGYNDEVDYLIRRLVKSSRTVESEIQRLNRIENYRKEFIGDISHELKTPIFAIQGFIETLLNGALEDEEVNREFLKKAMRNVNRLTYLTRDLMEISKLETGELKSDFEEFYLFDVIHDVIESLQYKAEKEAVQLHFVEFDPKLRVNGDKQQIKQVLINLIENGIKYNVKGGEVDVGLLPIIKKPGRVTVYVQDTGIGIDESDLSRITERFFRVDKSRARERGGTGLGLSIVKHIMEAHGESLSYESVLNKGSVFKFSLQKVEGEPLH